MKPRAASFGALAADVWGVLAASPFWLAAHVATLAEIAEPQTGGFTNRNQKIQPTVVLADVDGKQISLAANASESQKQKLRDTINAYLKAKRA